ncbi:MAG: hypothetical protein DHS20C16_09950 [Phycisphaerae bacterium]|nr:MAG: hypothetical protein DHS20C16_09950 [Phycisphaerae bacterium]
MLSITAFFLIVFPIGVLTSVVLFVLNEFLRLLSPTLAIDSGLTTSAIGIATALTFSGWVSAYIYSYLRWKSVDRDNRFCINCDYDLTGNESGVCSECGEAL